MKETALYLPVKSLLESLGFDVYAEAINCDVIGRKQEELVIVELKKTLNLDETLHFLKKSPRFRVSS